MGLISEQVFDCHIAREIPCIVTSRYLRFQYKFLLANRVQSILEMVFIPNHNLFETTKIYRHLKVVSDQIRFYYDS